MPSVIAPELSLIEAPVIVLEPECIMLPEDVEQLARSEPGNIWLLAGLTELAVNPVANMKAIARVVFQFIIFPFPGLTRSNQLYLGSSHSIKYEE